MRMVVKPKFDVKRIINKTIEKDWINFQSRALNMGKALHKYMQSYINRNRKRQGGTGRLSKAIDFAILATAPARIHWGIGSISKLNTIAKYWYVINYGKKVTGGQFIPGGGKFVPGYFGTGNRPDSSLKGRGKESFTHSPRSSMGMYPGIIRPMHYIEATRYRLSRRLKRLIMGLRKGAK